MEEELRLNREAATAPSVDPLDDIIAKYEAKLAEGITTEPEVGDDDTTNTDTTPDDEPDVDETETDENNIPEEEEIVISQESQKKETSKPDVIEDNSEEDEKPLSRKQKGKLIKEIREELEAANAEKERLRAQVEEQQKAEAELQKEIDAALGTDKEYQEKEELALNGDTKAAEWVKTWKANRIFFEKLKKKSRSDVEKEFVDTYWEPLKGLPGVTYEIVTKPTFGEILKGVYDAGVSSTEQASQEKIEELQKEITTWKGRYNNLKVSAPAGKTRSPMGTGGETVAEKPFDWKKKYLKDGLPTDEFEALVDRYGFEAVITNKIPK